jgi:flavin-binding protein dodecin
LSEAVARVTKITSASTKSFQDAIESGLKRAAKTVRGITGLEVIEMKAKVEDNHIAEYRSTIEITFILE